ncbi:KxYKxGKxW signal peptide-contaiing protein, partial [Pediococcus acidilactici D3]
MEIKKHYKMFKSGKKWAFASIATASLGLVALNTNAEKAHADSDAQANTNSASQLDQQTKMAPVNEKQVTLSKPATVKASSAAVTAQSAAPASSAAQSAAKVNADSTAKADQHSAAAKVETKATTSSAVKPAKEAASANAVKAAPASSAAKKVSTSVASSAAPSSAASKTVTSAAVKDSAAKEAVSSAANVKSSSAAAKTSVNSSAVSEAAQKDAKAEKTAEKKTDNSSKDYTIDNTYRLADNEGSDQKTNNKIIVAHAVGQYSSARDVAIYEKREWDSSETYVQYIVGDGGRVYAVGEEGYVAWGAGKWANENAPVQVELAQTYSDSQFKKDYQTYVNLLRDSAKKWNIPTTLDSDEYTGIKSHIWVTEHVWGNHVDPYGYLGTHGITKEQFAHDLAYGFGNDAANDNQNNNQNDNHQNDNQNNQNNNHQNDSSNNQGNQNNQSYHVGDKVTIKNSASHWATGQSIYNGVKGHTYKIIQTNGHKLLLDQVISWINDGDVYKAGSNSGSSNNHNNNHTTNNA